MSAQSLVKSAFDPFQTLACKVLVSPDVVVEGDLTASSPSLDLGAQERDAERQRGC